MKRLFFLLFLLVIGSESIAQVVKIDTVKYKPLKANVVTKSFATNDYNYSVGVKIFSLEQFPKILNQYNDYKFRRSFFNGIVAKINDNLLSYRFLGSYYKNNITFSNECKDCETVNGNLRDYYIKFGFEKNVTYSKLQPYFGLDLGFRKNLFTGSSTGAANTTSSVSYDVTAEKNSGILSPVVGIKYAVINHITVSLESSIDLMLSSEKQSKRFNDANASFTNQTKSRWELLQKPVGFLSIQYNFSQNY